MIDKTNIVEIARVRAYQKYSTNTNGIIPYMIGFCDGARLNLNSLWHDGSDAPAYAEKCLVELTDDYNDSNKLYVVSAEYRGGGWDCNVSLLVREDYKITRWLYISDLLIGGEE